MRFLRTTAAAIGIRGGEERPVALLLFHSFAMGLSTVFFETAASALFLSRFDKAALPWVYIAAAVVNVVTGLFYATVRERVRFPRLMQGTLVFLFLSVLLLWTGQRLTEAAVLTFSLLVFYRVLSALTDLEYWAVATRLFDVRQAKRLFGLIGSGEVVARILGSFSVPLVLNFIGVPHLMLISAAGLAACLVLVAVLLRSPAKDAPPPARRETRGSVDTGIGSIFRLLQRPYLVLLFSVTVTAVLGKYFVDFAFLAEMKSRYAGAKALASFFGLFSGATQALSLLTRVLVSGRLLGRFGIRVGLMVLPVAHLFCTIALIVQGGFVGPESVAVFWLVVANQGIYKILKHPIDNPSFKVLYQPLRPEERLGAQIAVETIVTPLAIGFAGGVMLLFSLGGLYHPARFGLVLLATFLAWIVAVIRTGRAYPDALSEALKGRIADEQLDFEDPRSFKILEQILKTGRPAEVLFALDLLDQGEHPRLTAILADLLSHPSEEVRVSALNRIQKGVRSQALPAVRRAIEGETSSVVRAAALRCRCALGGDTATAEVSPFLDHSDPAVRRAALIGLLQLERDAGASFASTYLRSLSDSRRVEKRILAAQVVAEVGRSGLSSVVLRLLEDDVVAVRRAALVAAGKTKDPALWKAVVACLEDQRLASTAMAALAAGKDQALPALKRAWKSARSAKLRVRLIETLVRGQAEKAVPLLYEAAGANDPRVRQAALIALRPVGERPSEVDQPRLRELVMSEAAEATRLLAAVRDLGAAASGQLSKALEKEWTGCRDRMLLGLELMYDTTAIMRAREHLSDPAKEKRAYALEILDVELPREMKDALLPLCDELKDAERVRRLQEAFPQDERTVEERLAEIVGDAARRLPWTRATALSAVGHQPLPGLRDVVRAVLAEKDADRVVSETADWALRRLERVSDAEDGRRPMLAIEKVITLKAVPMFESASEEVLADIGAILEEVELQPGQVIFEKGEVGDSMYIVIEGRVRVYDGERTITHFGEKEIFGELALLDPEPRSASIAAVAPTRLFRLDREAFSELMAGNIEIVRGVLSVLCQRLRCQTT